MQKKYLLAPLLASLVISAHAADTYFVLSELLASDSVKELLDPNIKMYWGSQVTPDFSEIARPDPYTRSSISLSPFGGSKKHCIEAFEKTLKEIVIDARNRGYDAVVNLQPARDGKPSGDPAGFNCKPGYKTTEVSLIGSFAMTTGAVQRMAEAEQRTTHLPPRNPAANAIFLPLDPILISPEARAILEPGINAYSGIKAPAYSQRYGPDEYSEEADTKSLGKEDACKQAVLNTLRAMVQDAKERGFDSIIKIRSFLSEQFAPVATDVECQIGRKTANVRLQASLASKK
jgi:uncharacterized protein YbjQ (UPF0145 family)